VLVACVAPRYCRFVPEHDSQAPEAAAEPAQPTGCPLALPAPPAAILARVAAGQADPALALRVARATGNRGLQAARRQLARLEDPGTYFDPTSDPTYAKVLPLLRRSPWGRDALDVMVKYKVKTVLDPSGPPANFAQQLNRVKLNPTLRDDVLSAYFVHEMYHASQYHEGKSPGPDSHDDKGKWVKLLVDEEIEGTARGYLHKLQLERTSPRAPADDKPPWMGFFRGAFDHAFEAAKAQGKDIDTCRAEGRANGRLMAEELIRPHNKRDRQHLGPGELISYTEYYANEWEAAQKKKAAQGAAAAPH
jgi:hypothetical protein